MSRSKISECSLSQVNDEYDSDIEIKLSSSEWQFWKLRVDKEMRNMRERLSALERRGKDKSESNKARRSQSFTTAQEDGVSRLRTFALLVGSTKLAFLQCVWLAVIVVVLLTFGIVEFIRARDNTRAVFKPEKKLQTVDFSDSKIDLEYEIPYIYLYFGCYKLNRDVNDDLSFEEINETLTYLLESQSYFENSASIFYYEIDNEDDNVFSIETIDAKAFYEEDQVSGSYFNGYFKLQLANPDPSQGAFQYGISFNTEGLTAGGTQRFEGFRVNVARGNYKVEVTEFLNIPSNNAISGESQIEATIDYDERNVHHWQKGHVSYITATLELYSEYENNFDSQVGSVSLIFRPNLMIGYWEEYVDYGYYNWISSLGGMLSICSVTFFFGAYRLSKIFGEENTLGILPGISMVYSNLEKIHEYRKI